MSQRVVPCHLALVELIVTLLLGVVVGGVVGCSSNVEPPLPAGRCNFHEDCPDGHRCVGTYCEDIYHPDIKIKQR